MDRSLILLPIKVNSKRIYQKNLRNLNGKCLFEYALNAIWDVNISNAHRLISTEDKKLIDIIDGNFDREDFPFGMIRRPMILSEDPAQLKDVALHALRGIDTDPKILIIVQPSNPFVTPVDIENCHKLFLDNDRRCVRSIIKTTKNTMRSFIMVGGKLIPANPAFNRMRDIEEKDMFDTYFGNGSIVVCDVEEFKREKTLLLENTIGYEMDGIDIDVEEDFLLADILMK